MNKFKLLISHKIIQRLPLCIQRKHKEIYKKQKEFFSKPRLLTIYITARNKIMIFGQNLKMKEKWKKKQGLEQSRGVSI